MKYENVAKQPTLHSHHFVRLPCTNGPTCYCPDH